MKNEHNKYWISKKLIATVLIGILSFSLLPSYVDAEQKASSSTAVLQVSATVKGFINFEIHYQSSELVITSSDIRRGYIDVTTGTRFFVKTNVSEGYLLNFDNHGGPFERIIVNDGSRHQEVTGVGGGILMPYSGGRAGEMKELSYRFYLDKDASPGTYTWPIPISEYAI